jgi:hypothetical protein
MDILEFKKILTAFADEPSDVDIRLGKVVAQLRDEIIDASISTKQESGELIVQEGGQYYRARSWLINRVAKLPQLADRIISNATVPAALAKKSPFVPPSGTLSEDIALQDEDSCTDKSAVDVLLSAASIPVPGATRVLYITSDAGEGKTTIINRAAYQQAVQFKAKESYSLIVPIPLSGKAFLTFDDAVIAALVNKLRFSYLYYDAFIHLVRLGAVIPAFDGYEEMLVEGSKGEAVSALGNMVQNLDSSGTVFIAARKAFFEYVSFKTQAKLLDAIGDRSAAFSRLALHRWSRAQFCEYGRLRDVASPEEIYEAVSTRMGKDHPLLTRAVLVRRLFDVAEVTQQRSELIDLLGTNPADYFYTFVDAIVKREASEKWLERDLLEPLITIEEHHLLLTQIASEMWQTSANSLRYDVVDVVVELFMDGKKRGAGVVRQVKERIKQHSLLATDVARGQALAFDHEDFQSFYMGEGLGQLLAKASQPELRSFLSVNLVPAATVEQAVQFLVRQKSDLNQALESILGISSSESGFSFCKENCSAIAIRIAECLDCSGGRTVLSLMFFSIESLSGRTLRNVVFESCHFQPTSSRMSEFSGVVFRECEFERLETFKPSGLRGCTFDECRIDSLIIGEDEHTFNPIVIKSWLVSAGASIGSETAEMVTQELFPADERFKILEKFLKFFTKSTHMDETFIRLRIGKVYAAEFFDEMLPHLISAGIVEEVLWKGQGVQHRYKLRVAMNEVSKALQESQGSFEGFLSAFS